MCGPSMACNLDMWKWMMMMMSPLVKLLKMILMGRVGYWDDPFHISFVKVHICWCWGACFYSDSVEDYYDFLVST